MKKFWEAFENWISFNKIENKIMKNLANPPENLNDEWKHLKCYSNSKIKILEYDTHCPCDLHLQHHVTNLISTKNFR